MMVRNTILVVGIFLFCVSGFSDLKNEAGNFSLRGGLAKGTVTWLGPVTTAMFKVGAGVDYWFNKNFALSADLGLGSEGYGKVIGTTSESMVNLKTGYFIIDPGITATFALDSIKHFTPYANIRLGFPLLTGYSGAFSLGPGIGTLITITDWVALDLLANVNVVANFKFTYLATIFSIGSIGFRVFF
jgi:hypothetical protein